MGPDSSWSTLSASTLCIQPRESLSGAGSAPEPGFCGSSQILPPLFTPCSPTLITHSFQGKDGQSQTPHPPPLQRAGPDHSPTTLWCGKESGTAAGTQGCSSHPRRGCGLGCPVFKHQKQKLSGPSFLEHVPVEMLRTHAHTQLLPVSFSNPNSKMLDVTSVRKIMILQ